MDSDRFRIFMFIGIGVVVIFILSYGAYLVWFHDWGGAGDDGQSGQLPDGTKIVKNQPANTNTKSQDGDNPGGSDVNNPVNNQPGADNIFKKRTFATDNDFEKMIEDMLAQVRSMDMFKHNEAMVVLTKIGKPAVPGLLEVLETVEDPSIKCDIVRALGKIGDKRALQTLLNIANGPDGILNIAVIQALGELRDKSAVPVLLDAINDSSSNRKMVIEALVKIGDKSVVPVLLEQLEKDWLAPYDKEEIIIALGEFGGQDALKTVIKIFKDENADLSHRYRAAEALGKIGGKEAVETLVNYVNDKSDGIRGCAIAALGNPANADAIPVLVELLRKKKDNNIFVEILAFSKIGKAAVPTLVNLLQDGNRIVRNGAAGALALIGDPDSILPLVNAFRANNLRPGSDRDYGLDKTLADTMVKAGKPAIKTIITVLNYEEDELKAAAAQALKEIADPATIPILINALDCKSSRVKFLVIDTLVRIGEPAIEPVINVLKIGGAEQRVSASEILSRLCRRTTVPALIDALNDTNPQVCQHSAEGLGKLRDKSAIPALAKALRTENDSLRTAVKNALEKIGAPVTDELVKMSQSEGAEVHKAVIEILGKVGNKSAVPTLIQALSGQDIGVRHTAATGLARIGDASAVQPLANLLYSENESLRYTVRTALVRFGKPAAPIFIKQLNNGDKKDRLGTIEALKKIRDKSAVQPLIEQLKDSDAEIRRNVIEALHSIGDKSAAPDIINCLADPDRQVKVQAIYALNKFGDKSTVPAIIKCLNDSDAGVRSLASSLLSTITRQYFGTDAAKWQDWWEKNKDK